MWYSRRLRGFPFAGIDTGSPNSNARRAASIARSTSAGVDFWNTPRRSPVFAGLRFSKLSPETEGTHAPSIKL